MKHLVSDEVFSGSIGFNDGFDHILRDIVEVGQKLLRVLRQAVAAVAKAWVIVVSTDTGIKTDTINDLLSVEPF